MNFKLIHGLALVLSGVLIGSRGIAHAGTTQGIKPEHQLQPFEFASIRMIDRRNGWAQNAAAVFRTNDWVFSDQAILRTTDGGKSWKYVFSTETNHTLSSFFYDSQTAWVTDILDEGTNVAILHTKDGGRSWSKTELKESHLIMESFLSFPNARTGWLMLIPDHGMNSSPGDLYRTDDGGANWQPVNSTCAEPLTYEIVRDNLRRFLSNRTLALGKSPGYGTDNYTSAEFESRHSYLFYAGPIAFRNASTGWFWGSVVSTGPCFMSVTRDGGLNWQVQTLPLPSSLQNGRMAPIGPPRFFPANGKDGFVPAEFQPADGRSTNYCTLIYRTHDGGSTWQPATPVKFRCVWDFISAQKGWIWSAEPHNTGSTAPVRGNLYRTDDGAASWKPVNAQKSLQEYLTHGEDIVQLNFVDGENGWAIARDCHNLTQLLQTIDGGKTWNLVQVKIQP